MFGASKRALLALSAGAAALAGTSAMGQVVVLMDQIGPNAASVVYQTINGSQDFESGFDAYDIAVLDDFTLTSNQHLSRVEAVVGGWNGFGTGSYGLITGYRVEIFSSPAVAALSLTGDVKSWLAPLSSVVTDDNGGAGYGSGATFARLVSITLPSIGDGQAIDLTPGTYWIAVMPQLNFAGGGQCGVMRNGWGGAFPAGGNGEQANPAGAFGLGGGTNHAPIGGNAAYRVTGDNGAVPSDPLASGSAAPGLPEQGSNVLLKVQVVPGANPTSTDLSVTVNMSSLTGGSGSQTFYDDGTHGDQFIGDKVFSYQFALNNSQATGPYSLPFHVEDGQSRFVNGSISFTVVPKSWNETTNGGGDAGDLTVSAQTVTGDGSLAAITGTLDASDADMYRIKICDIDTFAATTVNGSTGDTQLWLFYANGNGLMFNDDTAANPQSRLDNLSGFITETGEYYLAISMYDHDAVDNAAAEIWNDGPFTAIRFPDGPGQLNPVAGWNGAVGAGGNYRIFLTGACYIAGGTVACSIADIATEGNPDVQAGPDGFITGVDADAFIECFNNLTRKKLPADPPAGPFTGPYIADVIGDLGVGPPNGFVEGVDADAFFEAYFIGC